MKRNPFLLIAGIACFYGLVISVANIANVNAVVYFTQIIPVQTDSLGVVMLYVFIIGAIMGYTLSLGLHNKKKREDRPEF